MKTDWAQQEREMDALVKELYGLVPERTEMQQLRQRVADALERTRAAKPVTGMGLEGRLTMQGVQAGSAAMLETVLDWIDEIEEGKDAHNITPD